MNDLILIRELLDPTATTVEARQIARAIEITRPTVLPNPSPYPRVNGRPGVQTRQPEPPAKMKITTLQG